MGEGIWAENKLIEGRAEDLPGDVRRIAADERFVREASAADLNHPNMRKYEIGERDGHPSVP